ncbi:MAG: YdcF family protein [Bacteroidetes bacterium]|nr:YdcF family protein [Bacteroidota bacterium]
MQTKKIIRWCLWRLGIFILLVLAAYVFRRPLMRAAGNYLIEEDELKKSEAVFVLSGGPADRAAEAARLIKSGYASVAVCTGESVPGLFEVIGDSTDEADLSRISLLDNGIPEEQIQVIHQGTSTKEESEIIINYCIAMNWKRIIVVSDRFHTNRINYAFRKTFDESGVEILLRGAPSTRYKEDMWWANEAGLLMVNNEYVKLFYYYLHY